MQELKLIGVEDRELILAADDGATFRLQITAMVEAAVRPPVTPSHKSRNSPSPRELQALLRSGLSVEQVAEQTGVSIDDIRRFEAPIAAELAYMIDNARDVALRLSGSGSSDEGSSFGEIIDSRLASREVTDATWSSWKEDAGWIIQLEFTSGGAHLDARWSFDPKRKSLMPTNDDARSISSEESSVPTRAVRLRAIPNHEEQQPSAPAIYDRELDTGALFDGAEDSPFEAAPTGVATVTPLGSRRDDAGEIGDVVETADLLDALRQRRGERQPATSDPSEDSEYDFAFTAESLDGDVEAPEEPQQGFIPTIVPGASAQSPEPAPSPFAPPADGTSTPDGRSDSPASHGKQRTNRPSMPSWDEIVFGSRGSSDDSDPN